MLAVEVGFNAIYAEPLATVNAYVFVVVPKLIVPVAAGRFRISVDEVKRN